VGYPHSHRGRGREGSSEFPAIFHGLARCCDTSDRHETHKALTSLRSLLLLGEAPLGILGMLARQVRILWRIKAGIEQGWSTEDLVKKLKLSPYLVKNLSREATRFSEADLREIHEALRETDLALKSTGLAADRVLESLVLRFARKRPPGITP